MAKLTPNIGSPGKLTLKPGNDGNVGRAGTGGMGKAKLKPSVGNAQLLMWRFRFRSPWPDH